MKKSVGKCDASDETAEVMVWAVAVSKISVEVLVIAV